MIHILPHLEEQIESNKTPEDICMILQSVTDSRKVGLYANNEFFGQVHPLGFRITPRLNYRNSFVPVLTGNMTEKEGGTTIEITLQMHIFTRIFLIVWNVMAWFIFLCSIPAVFTGGLEQISIILVPLGFIIFGQVFPRCCFYGPAKKALERLKELLCQRESLSKKKRIYTEYSGKGEYRREHCAFEPDRVNQCTTVLYRSIAEQEDTEHEICD